MVLIDEIFLLIYSALDNLIYCYWDLERSTHVLTSIKKYILDNNAKSTLYPKLTFETI